MNRKKVLIIGTEVATNGLESGGSLRINGIKELLEGLDLNVRVASRYDAKVALRDKWDLVVLVSFATARLLRPARKSSNSIWFDPTDSWRLTHFSLIRVWDLKHILILIRDLFWIWTAPRVDFITFITRRDSDNEKVWWSRRSNPIIYPVLNLNRVINPSLKIRLVFVGDGDYRPNIEAIAFLTRVLELLPTTTRIHVYGKGFRGIDSRFILHGYSSSDEMYFQNDVHLAPIATGAGLKSKVAVPLANGLRVISTPEGANGLKLNTNLMVALDEETFASLILQLKITHSKAIFVEPTDIYQDQESSKVIEWVENHVLRFS